jgi:hypothetical protein
LGFAGVAFSFLLGFSPQTQLPVRSPTLYVRLVVGGTVVFTGPPPPNGTLKQPSRRAVSPPKVSSLKAA